MEPGKPAPCGDPAHVGDDSSSKAAWQPQTELPATAWPDSAAAGTDDCAPTPECGPSTFRPRAGTPATGRRGRACGTMSHPPSDMNPHGGPPLVREASVSASWSRSDHKRRVTGGYWRARVRTAALMSAQLRGTGRCEAVRVGRGRSGVRVLPPEQIARSQVSGVAFGVGVPPPTPRSLMKSLVSDVPRLDGGRWSRSGHKVCLATWRWMPGFGHCW